MPSPPSSKRANPFQGLAYYEEKDEKRFAGRQRDVEAVVNGILRTRTFVVYGRSGLGKTSLLLAGVFPQLAGQGCRTLAVRLLEDPLGDLRRALIRNGNPAAQDAEPESLASLIERAGRDADGKERLMVIVFDQFEEFFVRFADQPDPAGGVRSGEELDRAVRQQRIAQREAFIREIGTLAADARLNLRLVFSLREDWIAEMADFSDAVPEITHHMLRLLPLTSFGVRQAILETLRSAGTQADSRLVSALVDTLADVHFDPIVLQVLCSEVWERAEARGQEGEPVRLELRDLEAIGGVRQVFRGYLDQVNSEIDAKDLRRKIHTGAVLDALISEKRTKLAISRDSLLQQSFAITGEELDEVLDRLVRHRLVRSDPRGDIHWYELVHERLISAILEWFAVDLDFFKFRGARNLVLNSCRNGGWKDNPELLLNRGQLDDTVGPFKDLLCFNAEERLFLVSSAIYAHSRDLEFWADLAGDETSADLIERFLGQTQNERLRRRAAEAAGRVAERREHFAALCLDHAVHDPSSEVRKAAGRSFADLAGPSDYQALAKRLKEKENRNAALDVLTEVMDKDKLPTGIKLSRFRLWQARKKLYRRRLEAGQDSIRMRSLRGLQSGLSAALVWSLTAGLLLAWILVFEIYPDLGLSSLKAWPAAVGVLLLCALPLGMGVGWHAARRAAMAALRHGREGISFQGLLSGGMLLKIGLLFLLVCLVAGLIVPGLYLLLFAVGLCAVVLPAALVPLALRTIQPGDGPSIASRLWAWTWAFGGSLLPSLVSVILLVDTPFQSSASLCLAVSALFGGLATYSGLLAVASTSSGDSSQAEQPPERTRRTLGTVLALVSTVLLLYIFGWDSLPLLAHRVVLKDADARVEPAGFEFFFPAGSVLSNALHLQLSAESKPAAPRLAQVITPPSWRFFAVLGPDSDLILQPGESRRLVFNAPEQGSLLIRPDRPLSGLPPPSGQLVVVRLTRKEGTWSGPIPGLESLRKEGKPLTLAFGNVIQGGDWCQNAAFGLHFSGMDESGPDMPAFHCLPKPRETSFGRKISWNPGSTASTIELRTWEPVELAHGTAIWAAFTPDGLRVATLALAADRLSDADETQHLDIWPRDGSEARSHLRLATLGEGAVFSPDGNWIAVLSKDHKVNLVKAGGSHQSILLPTLQSVGRALFSPDSALLATEENDLLEIWKVGGDRPVAKLPQTGRQISDVAFSPDGKRLATGDDQKTVRVWTLDDLSRPPVELRLDRTSAENPADSWIRHLSFSPDGTRLLFVTADSTHLWKFSGAREPVVDLPRTDGVLEAVFSRDGSHLLTGTAKSVWIWPVDGSRVGPAAMLPVNDCRTMTFSPDRLRAATVSEDGTVRIWNLNGSGEPVALPREDGVKTIEFSRDGTHLLTTAESGPAKVWDLVHPFHRRVNADLFVFLRVSPDLGPQ